MRHKIICDFEISTDYLIPDRRADPLLVKKKKRITIEWVKQFCSFVRAISGKSCVIWVWCLYALLLVCLEQSPKVWKKDWRNWKLKKKSQLSWPLHSQNRLKCTEKYWGPEKAFCHPGSRKMNTIGVKMCIKRKKSILMSVFEIIGCGSLYIYCTLKHSKTLK